MAKMVIVRHKDGREYGVPEDRAEKETQKGGELEGFKIVSYADGSPYQAPRRTEKAEKSE